jgi:hypothetical protein
MSTLVAQTISNGTVSTSSANVIQGSAKAWVNFNGTGPAVRASYNVSSVTRTSAGFYTVNFTNSLADSNYAVVGSGATTNSASWVVVGPYSPSNNSYSNKTNSACALNVYSSAVSYYDPFEIDVSFFR